MKVNFHFRILLFTTLLVCLNSSADVISLNPDKVNLTVYRDDDYGDEVIQLDDSYSNDAGLVMVSEERSVHLPAGESRILFRGVADSIIPQTTKLEDLKGQIIESNFDYSLLGIYDLFSKSVGKPVTLSSTNLQTGKITERQAVIRSGEAGVLFEVDGRLEEFTCGGDPEQIIFSSIPHGLVSDPTLSVNVRVKEEGLFKINLHYLAVGVQWSADYVAQINEDNKTLNLSAWITLVNARNTSFKNAPVQVVAGRVNRDREETTSPKIQFSRAGSTCWPAINSPIRYFDGDYSAVEEVIVTGIRASVNLSELGDYKLYTLPNETTLAARQSKQVVMFEHEKVLFERIYNYQYSVENLIDNDDIEDNLVDSFKPNILLRINNTQSNNLGIPLPSGKVSVMDSTNQRMLFMGQQHITDTPAGLPVEIILGKEPDIVISRYVTKIREDEDSNSVRIKVNLFLDSYKSSTSAIEIQQDPSEYYEAKVVSESTKHMSKNGNYVWLIKLKSGARKHLQYEMIIKESEL